MFKLGDYVKPKPEYVECPNNIPTGRIRAFGMAGFALYVGDEKRAFGNYVFDLTEPPTDTPPIIEAPADVPEPRQYVLPGLSQE